MALLRGALLCGVLLAVEHAAAFAPSAGLISGQGRGNMGARQTKDAAVPPRHFSAGRRVFMMNASKDPVDETSSRAKLQLEALSKSANVNLDAAIADAKSVQAPTVAGREAGVVSDSTDETREEKLARAQKMIEKVRGTASAGDGGNHGVGGRGALCRAHPCSSGLASAGCTACGRRCGRSSKSPPCRTTRPTCRWRRGAPRCGS